jgi:integrase
MARAETERINFTKHGLDALQLSGPTARQWFDERVAGLGVVVHPSGRKTFFHLRKVHGWPRRTTIGQFPDLTVEQARGKASDLNAKLARWRNDDFQGEDPFQRRSRDQTLNELVESYIELRVKAHAHRPERATKDVRGIAATYLTTWKQRKIGSIRQQDVRELHDDLGKKGHRVTANRVVQFLRTLYNWASEHGWRGVNPVHNIKFFPEARREEFLQPDQVSRLLRALKKEPNADLRDFVKIALFTGARRGDVFSARWENINLDTATWRVPKPKTRGRESKPYNVTLAPDVVKLLKARRNDSVWVFPSHGATGHLVNLKKPWQRLLKRAEIQNIRMHDLRRTLGSWQATAGASLPIIGASLGHTSQAATSIYAKLQLDAVRDSVTQATDAMKAAAKKRPKASNGC